MKRERTREKREKETVMFLSSLDENKITKNETRESEREREKKNLEVQRERERDIT